MNNRTSRKAPPHEQPYESQGPTTWKFTESHIIDLMRRLLSGRKQQGGHAATRDDVTGGRTEEEDWGEGRRVSRDKDGGKKAACIKRRGLRRAARLWFVLTLAVVLSEWGAGALRDAVRQAGDVASRRWAAGARGEPEAANTRASGESAGGARREFHHVTAAGSAWQRHNFMRVRMRCHVHEPCQDVVVCLFSC